jgi:hypothetical protein
MGIIRPYGADEMEPDVAVIEPVANPARGFDYDFFHALSVPEIDESSTSLFRCISTTYNLFGKYFK